MNMDRVSKWLAIAGLVVVALAFVLNPSDGEDRRTFMRECQDNGMRHFQCVAIWRGGASMLIIPTPAYNYMLPVDPN